MKKGELLYRRLVLVIVFFVSSFPGESQILCSNKYANFVPDSVTAVKVAEAIWFPLYGKLIYEEEPYRAILIGDSVWSVEGTQVSKGGSAMIKIRKSDGKILFVCHGK